MLGIPAESAIVQRLAMFAGRGLQRRNCAPLQ
nr:MAG TPA: hypothetical protein [Caudoviricetes sp.]